MSENKPKIVQLTGIADPSPASLAALDSAGNIFVYMKATRRWALMRCPIQDYEKHLEKGAADERHHSE